MEERVFIRIDDDQQLDNTLHFADELSKAGLTVLDVSPVVGQITGMIDSDGMLRLRQLVEAMGLRLVPADTDASHLLPPEGFDLQ